MKPLSLPACVAIDAAQPAHEAMVPAPSAAGPLRAPVARLALSHVALPLALGVASYALFSASVERLVGLGVLAPLRVLRRVTLPVATRIPDVLRFHVADAAWGWALGAALSLVWAGAGARGRRAWFVAGFALVVGEELGQLAGLMPGTFDVLDIVVSAAAYVIAWRLVSNTASRTEVLSHG